MKTVKQKIGPVIMGLCLIGATFWFETSVNPTAELVRERLNNLIYDIRIQLGLFKRSNLVHTDVVVVDIDEKSLREEGRWPWSRQKLAELVDNLREYGAIVIAFDVVFAEPERNLTEEMLTELSDEPNIPPDFKEDVQALKHLFDYDQLFAEEMEEQDDVVLGYVLTHNPNDQVGTLPPPVLTMTPEMSERTLISNMPGKIANISKLQTDKNNGGFVTNIADTDGVIRHYALILAHEDGLYPSLGLAAVMKYYFINQLDFKFVTIEDYIALEGFMLGDRMVPTDENGQVLIPYHGLSGSLPYFSATDVIQMKLPNRALENKLVFIGTSAYGLGDLHATPFESSYPGVEIHATLADALIQRDIPIQPDWDVGAKVVMILFIGLLLAFILPFMSLFSVIVVPILLIGLMIYFNQWLWIKHHIYLSTITIYIMLLALSMINIVFGFLLESKRRLHLKAMFGQYVPPAHVDKMSESDKAYTFEGESRIMSVLFADIRDFTKISESLEPNQLKQLLNDYFTPMTQIIFDHNGTIDKYVGDMIMAFWGAPLENEHHALDAVKAGFAMQEKANELAEQFKSIGVEDIRIGVGVNSGQMNVGDMGSKYRRSYTVLGDSVNLASRIESATKYYGVNMIISEDTLKGCENEVVCKHLDRVKVKGKAHAVEIFEPICFKKDLDEVIKSELKAYHIALEYYHQAEWDKALPAFEALTQEHPKTKLYHLYVKRVQKLKEQGVTAPWDGCFVRDEK